MKEHQHVAAHGEKKPTEAEISMQELWAEAAKSFEDICGKSLQKGEIKKFDDVQKKIEEAGRTSNDSGGGKEDKWDKARSVAFKSLGYLKLIAGAGLQAASFVPVPASAVNIASCAMFFVFDIPERIKGYNDAVEAVFGEISSALSQFQIYTSMEQIDPKLLHSIQAVMVSFVKLCAHVVRYRQSRKRDRFATQFKTIFQDDSGLSDELAEFKKALQQQRDIEGTLTLAMVIETRHDMAVNLQNWAIINDRTEKTHQVVQETQKGVQAINDDSARVKKLGKIRDALGIPERMGLETSSTPECTTLANGCSAGTGAWIWDHGDYKTWTAPTLDKEDGSHVLIVSGPGSSGKSSAVALITKRLEEQKERTYVAHYFFTRRGEKDDDNSSTARVKKGVDEKASVLSALKNMAFQFARVDETVREGLGNACDTVAQAFRHASANADLYKLWEELKIVTPGSGAIHYLVFDGLEHLLEPEAQKLRSFIFDPRLANQAPGRVRLLVSGTDEKFDQPGLIRTNTVPRIRIADHNEVDLRIVVEEALKQEDMLQSAEPDSIQQKTREKIIEKLPKNVGGSYSSLQFGIQDVIRLLSRRTPAEDLDRVLEQSTSSQEAAIKNLQRSLAMEEIEELNELLKWVLFGRVPLTLNQLEAAMFLYSDTESLVSLQYVIKHKYSAICNIKDDCIQVEDKVKEYLQKVAEASKKSPHQKSDSTISMTIQIQNVEQDVVGHFLWDLAHKGIRDKFKFDFNIAAPGTTLSGSHAAIAVDEFDAHHTIVNRAFKYFKGEPNEKTRRLGMHLGSELPHHLAQLRQLEDEDKGSLDSKEKMEIGQNLYRLFKDPEIFQRHADIFGELWWWGFEMVGMQEWFNDSTAIRRVDKKWRDEVRKSTRPTRGYLKELVKMVIEGFLRARTWDSRNAVDWIIEFMAADKLKAEQNDRPSDDNSSDSSEERVIDLDRLSTWEDMGAWCQEFLKLPDSEVDALWYERLAEASSRYDCAADTVFSLYQRAIDKGNHSWMCHDGLARANHRKGKRTEAIAQLELAFEEIERADVTPKPEAKDVMLLRLQLGEYAYEVGENEKAGENYLIASKSEDTTLANWAHFGYFKVRLRSSDVGAVREFLRSKLTEKSNKEAMVDMLKKIAGDATYSELMWKIFHVAEGDPELLKDIMDAMEMTSPYDLDAVEKGGSEDYEARIRGILLFERGVGAYAYNISSDKSKDVKNALRFWNKSRDILSNVDALNASAVREEATDMLAQHYFHDMVDGKHSDHLDALAKLAKPDTDTYSSASKNLAMIYSLRGDKEQAIKSTAAWVKYGLQILSDDTPANDWLGLKAIRQAVEANQDYKRLAVVVLMRGQPDLVTYTLTFEIGDIQANEKANKEQILELATKLSADIIEVVKAKVPASSQQVERIAAAKEHVDSLADTWKMVSKSDGDNSEDQDKADEVKTASTEMALAYDFVSSRLTELQARHKMEVDFDDVWLGVRTCDGWLPDGKNCGVSASFEREFFHCVMCVDRDFCKSCLVRMRDPASGTHVKPCSPKHKWLRVPPLGQDVFAGDKAKTVRVPKEVRAMEGDESILEMYHGEDGGDEVEVEKWTEMLAKDWGISLDEVKKQTEKTDGE
ncbi:hypothetical protein B0I35DRAFT_390482 [Stachybotrys elegans]|uniref:Fungal STAND N-terminal Goodbye domain-containing protein n=1 Tax=Stachybotrys elegans TaxID=80388 RepID=A0A8K0WTI5_9HYPO|nr:hypothetical protein B0I35DRAFT_390482 [Stachybotrys elegans]